MGRDVPAFAPYEFNPSTWILNARVAIRDISMGSRAKAEFALWSRNLTNNRNPNFPFPFSTILYSDAYQQARTFGFDVILRY